MTKAQAMLAVFMTIFLTVYGQIVIKWQVAAYGKPPTNFNEKMLFLLQLLLNPWVLSGLLAAFGASLSWMLAMSKLDLNYAYPFVSLSFILIILSGAFFFNESLSMWKIVGAILIVAGVTVGSRG